MSRTAPLNDIRRNDLQTPPLAQRLVSRPKSRNGPASAWDDAPDAADMLDLPTKDGSRAATARPESGSLQQARAGGGSVATARAAARSGSAQRMPDAKPRSRPSSHSRNTGSADGARVRSRVKSRQRPAKSRE